MRRTLIGLLILMMLSSCGKVNEISVRGISNVTFRGLNKNVVLLTLDLEVDNPNTRKITISEVNLKAWLNDREFGTLTVPQKIALRPCSLSKYPVDVEIRLRTAAEALKLLGADMAKIAQRFEVEGYIKGKSFPFRKKIVIERQPFNELQNSL